MARLTRIDYDREMAFIATIPQKDRQLEVGVARYATNPDGESCEFAVVVTDLGFVLSSHPEDSGLKRGVLAL